MKDERVEAMNRLIELIEDLTLGALMNAVADDEVLEGEASWQTYLHYRDKAKDRTGEEQNDLEQNC